MQGRLLFQARSAKGQIIVCTAAFWFFAQWYQRMWTPAALVIDEAHEVADAIRNCLSFDITDWQLGRVVEMLSEMESPAMDPLKRFRNRMIHIVKSKPTFRLTLLQDTEVERLLGILDEIDDDALLRDLAKAIKSGKVNVANDREALLRVERLAVSLRRYIRALRLALPDKGRAPLNYLCAFYQAEEEEGAESSNRRVRCKLVVQSFYVAPVVERLLDAHTLAMSATIGQPGNFAFKSGIRGEYKSLGSLFSSDKTRVFLPTDTPNLSFKMKNTREPGKVLRQIAKKCRVLAKKDIRVLVVVISNKEREQFLRMCAEESVDVVSYGDNGRTAKQAAEAFVGGEGQVLVGTVANYGNGVDLPGRIAPVIFFLRPSYASPDDPATQFARKRWGHSRYWSLAQSEVMIEALQIRGRNVRSAKDQGVTIFVSQQFKGFLYAALPDWLKPAFRGKSTLDQCVDEAVALLATPVHAGAKQSQAL